MHARLRASSDLTSIAAVLYGLLLATGTIGNMNLSAIALRELDVVTGDVG